MKIDLHIPQTRDLEDAYNRILYSIQYEEGRLDLFYFAKISQWSRFDSRLGEIAVGYLARYWRSINPVGLNDAFLKTPWPNILGVFLEFCNEDSNLFLNWKKTATSDIKKANWELFFIGKRRVGGKLMLGDARFSLEEFRRWGYLAREVFINKQQGTAKCYKKSSYSSEVRSQILKALLDENIRITTRVYWEAIQRSVTIRQAERDLRNSRFLKQVGKTKARYWVKVKEGDQALQRSREIPRR